MLEFKLKSKNKKLLSQIAKGNAEKVTKLISQGANVNRKDERGWTPLHVASMQSNAGVIKAILSSCSINDHISDVTGDGFSNTALHIASKNGHSDVVALLLQKGANPDKENYAQETPLHIVDNIRLLLSDAQNSNGETALDYSKNENIRNLLKKYNQEKKIINFKCEVDFKFDSKPATSTF